MKMNALWAALTLLYSLGLLWIYARPAAGAAPGSPRFRVSGALLIALLAGMLFMAVSLLTQRSLLLASLSVEDTDATVNPAVSWLSRLSNLALVCISLPLLLNLLPFNVPIGGDRTKETSRKLLVLLLLTYVVMFFLSPFASAEGGLDHKAVYAFLAMSVMLVATPADCQIVLRVIKAELVFFCFASLCFVVLDRDRVIAPNYEGLVSFIHFRFFGLAAHANAMGPIAGLVLLLEIAVPTRAWPIRWLIFAIGAVVLLLAQSKTALGGVLIGLYATWLAAQSQRPKRFLNVGLTSVLIGGLAVTLILLAVSFSGKWDHLLFRLGGFTQKLDLARVSGRADIWREALSAFSAHPVFGYGSLIWGDEFRAEVRLNYAFHAHNQFLQTLSESGLVGFTGLIAFLVATVRFLVRAIPASHGASLGLLMMFLIRFLTEAPVKAEAIGTGETMLLLVVMCFWRIGASLGAQTRQVPAVAPLPLDVRLNAAR